MVRDVQTMKLSITRIFLYVGTGVFLLAIGFCCGEYQGGKRATYISNATTLGWLTGIDMALDKGNVIDARQRTDLAIDGHVAVLTALGEHHYLNVLVFNSPWMWANNLSLADNILGKTNLYFAKMPDRLRPETKDYLSSHGGNSP